MASNTQNFQTVITLNTQQAKNELDALNQKIKDLEAKKAAALKSGASWSKEDAKDLRQARAEAKAYQSTVMSTINTLSNLENAKIGDVKAAMRSLKKVMDETTDPKDYQALETFLDQCKLRISGMSDATRVTADEMRKLINESQAVAQVLGNIDNASLQQLREARSALQNAMARAVPDSDPYKQQSESLAKVQRRIRQIEASQQNVNTLVEQYDNEIKNCQKSTEEIQKENDIISKTLKSVSSSSIRQLELAREMVNDRLQYTKQDSDEFKKLTQQAKQLNTQLEIAKAKSASTRSIWAKTADFFNENWGFFTQAIGAVSGLTMTIRQCAQAYAEMEDTMANVRKYTGQTDEQVRQMNEDFKKMDTRTSREQLNELAGAAGRLGKQSKEDIEEFVDAADKINVALGDDLGKGAVDKIGKLTNVFGEEERLGLKQAMLATGSAINELAQNSSANAGYIVDFTADLAGVGRQAGMTQAQIMGLASALDQNMQEESTASTVFSQLITKMFQEPAKFAGIAGIEVKKFSDLLKKDANAAMLEFMQSMQDKGGFAQMAPMFESMNLNGTRAVGVLSSVATHLDQVRTAQNLAAREYEKGESILNEFNTNNTTVNAELDKAKKKFNDLTIELGQKLNPVAKAGITSGSLLVNVLSVLATVVAKARATLISLTAAIVLYNIAINLSIIKTKLLVFWNEKVVLSFKKAWAVLRANPYGAMMAAIGLVIGVVIDLTRHNNELSRSLQSLAKVEDEAAVKAAEEGGRMERLRKIVNDNTRSVKERKAAIAEIQKVIPNYVATINGEGNAYKRNTKLLNDYINKLKEKALVQGARKEMEKLGQEIAHTTVEVAKQEAALEKARKQREALRDAPAFTTSAGTSATGAMDAMMGGQIAGMQSRLDGLKKTATEASNALQTLQDKFGKSIAEDDLSLRDGKSGGSNAPTNYESERDRKKRLAAEAKAERDRKRQRREAMQAEIEDAKNATDQLQAENTLRYYRGEIDYREYTRQQRQIAINGLQSLMDVYKKYGDTSKQLEAEQARELFEQKRDESKQNVAELDRQYAAEQLKLKLALYDSSSGLYKNEDAANEALFQLQIDYLDKKKDLQIKGSEERADTEAEIQELEERHRLELAQRYEERLQQYREQWGLKSAKEQEAIALKGLDDLHEKGLVKEKEYQEMLKAIRLHYAKEQSQDSLENSKGEQFKRNAHDAYETASNNAQADYQNDHPTGTGVLDYITSDVTIFSSTLDNIRKMEKDGVISHEEAMAAMGEATGDMCNGLAAKMQAAYDQVSSIMDGMSSYYSAQSDYEVTVTEKKYDKLIERAGSNTAKTKKLEEKKEKEVAKIKTKYAKKQAAMQVAQAIAQTAISAIAAYGSAMEGVPYPANLVLAPIAAGIALAAGAVQIATVKKQQQAQQAGYYEGGFTGGSSYRREAGVVHQGEFVANHNAVNNPQLLPALRLIDMAQRNNTVGALTAADVSRAMGVGSAPILSQPTVVINNDNQELAATLQEARDTIGRLGALLESGNINCRMPDWDEFDRSRKHFEKIKSNT